MKFPEDLSRDMDSILPNNHEHVKVQPGGGVARPIARRGKDSAVEWAATATNVQQYWD
jgi:hypothetical protein